MSSPRPFEEEERLFVIVWFKDFNEYPEQKGFLEIYRTINKHEFAFVGTFQQCLEHLKTQYDCELIPVTAENELTTEEALLEGVGKRPVLFRTDLFKTDRGFSVVCLVPAGIHRIYIG